MATGPVNNSRAVGGITTHTARTDKADEANASESSSDLAKADSRNAGMAAGVNISAAAKDRAVAQQRAKDIALSTPDIREDRVAMLKAQINDGTYQIDSGKIADGMLREAIKEHLATSE